MKTLVIHPQDRSTTFLSPIYEKVEDKTVITGGNVNKRILRRLIEEHDRVMMMGHGSTNGLFAVNFPLAGTYIIDYSLVDLLKTKQNNVFVWCNANVFVEHYELPGFYSGMFISEVGEANWFRIETNQHTVDESNNTFAKALGECINKPKQVMYEEIKSQYGLLVESNPVAAYNQPRLYLK